MSSLLKQQFEDIISLTDQEFEYILTHFTEKKLKKNSFLLQEGQQNVSKFFVTKGFLKSYYIDKSGKEHILQFAEPDWWIIGIETENTCRFNSMDCTDTRILGGLTYPLRPVAGFNPTPSINFGSNTGQLNSTETSYWQITELLFYNTELTLADKIAVENYFSNKYKHISFSNVSSTFNTFTSNCSNIISLYFYTYTYNHNITKILILLKMVIRK